MREDDRPQLPHSYYVYYTQVRKKSKKKLKICLPWPSDPRPTRRCSSSRAPSTTSSGDASAPLTGTERENDYTKYEFPHVWPPDSSRLEVTTASPSQLKPKPEVKDLLFGKTFTDHMFRVTWKAKEGWTTPRITPLENFSMHPGAKVLHYAQELFEGMKAYRGVDDRIRLFRPMHNMARMNMTAKRACLPTFDSFEFMECIRRLVQVDQEWIPHCTSSSLYIRPTLIGTEAALGVSPAAEAELFVVLCPVGPYYATGFKPVKLLADPSYIRAFPGGCGFAKMGSNYAPTLYIGAIAEKYGCQQVLWLYGDDHEVTEVGAMNVFALLKDKSGKKSLVTPPLDKVLLNF